MPRKLLHGELTLPGSDNSWHTELMAVQSFEKSVALVDLECFQLHVESTLKPFRYGIERELVDKHRDVLTAARDLFES